MFGYWYIPPKLPPDGEVRHLHAQPYVLAYDRFVHCTRVVQGNECEVINESGDVVQCFAVNTKQGYVLIATEGGDKKVKGEFRIVLTEATELKLHGTSRRQAQERAEKLRRTPAI